MKKKINILGLGLLAIAVLCGTSWATSVSFTPGSGMLSQFHYEATSCVAQVTLGHICVDLDSSTVCLGNGSSCVAVSGTGSIDSVLDDNTGAVPFLFQTWAAFGAGDATPDVSAGQHYRSVDTTTITGFDHGAGAITDGRHLTVYCGAATVFDLTSSEITAAGRTTDYTCAAGKVLEFVYNTDQWYLMDVPLETVAVGATKVVCTDANGDPAACTDINPPSANGGALGTTALEWADLFLADGGVIYFQNDQSVYLTPSAGTLTLTGKFATTGGISALTPVIGDPDNFAANFTGGNLYGGTFIANAAGTAALPDPAVGMNFTYVLEGANANIVDPLGTGTADTITMNGLAAAQDENVTSSTSGAMCVFQYRAANSWMATCNGFAEATPP